MFLEPFIEVSYFAVMFYLLKFSLYSYFINLINFVDGFGNEIFQFFGNYISLFLS